jgi:hypothetical protein
MHKKLPPQGTVKKKGRLDGADSGMFDCVMFLKNERLSGHLNSIFTRVFIFQHQGYFRQ